MCQAAGLSETGGCLRLREMGGAPRNHVLVWIINVQVLT